MEITLSAAELFLLSWAVCVTVASGYFYFEVKKLVFMCVAMSLTLRDIAEGKASAEMKDGVLNIKRILPLRKNEG
jgi:hypothetical protein